MSENIFKLNDDFNMPAVSLGTLSIGKQPKDIMHDAVQYAIKEVGYRHIDCARIYQNELEIGRALKGLFNNGFERKEIFITGKLWNNSHSSVEKALDISLKDLQLDYLDLYLMHWPIGFKDDEQLVPKDNDGKIIFSGIDYVQTWRAMIELKNTKKVKSIGVSNFNCYQLERLIKETGVAPTVNQVECHPYLPQKELIEFGKKHNIVIVAYAAIGRPNTPGETSEPQPILLKDKVISEIAKKYDKSPAQILLRFHLQRRSGLVIKSVTFNRIKENFSIFDFNLTDGDLNRLENLEINHRYCPNLEFKDHKYYPF